ncbi:MAG: threonine/serine exporter family protein [Clostridiales bacterium]|nr:threonine/serine exporter family protein [Clostridiales bacterium]
MLDIITCVLGTLGFCVILNVSHKKIIYAVAGGAISSVLLYFLLLSGAGTFISTFLSMICVCIYSEILSRIIKTPANVILLPASIPLLPGGSLYYTMSYIVRFDYEKLIYYAKETALTGFGIALGAVFVSVIIKMLKIGN